MGRLPPSFDGIAICHDGGDAATEAGKHGNHDEGTMMGVDLAKSVFQVRGASMTGQVKFRKKLTRMQFLRFMADHTPAVVVMEACGSAYFWSREMVRLGHEAKLIAPQCVKPFV